jgi:hypothetical protein
MGENWQKLRNLDNKSWDLSLQNCRELLQSEQKREFGKCKYWETWSCCLDADLPRPWTPIKASRRADSAEFSATCFVVVCAAIAVHFFVMLLELCWPAWALWANRSTSLHDPLPRSSFPLPSRVLVCAPQARQASPVWHTNAIARHSCSASLSLSDCLTQTYSLLVPELLLLLLSIQMELKHLQHFFFTDFYTKENADFRQLSIPLGLSHKHTYTQALFLFRRYFCFFLHKWNRKISITAFVQISIQKKSLISTSHRFENDRL